MSTSGIKFESDRCLLIERPEGVPLAYSDPYGSEGFHAWVTRRFGVSSKREHCLSAHFGEREWLLFSKDAGRQETSEIEVVPGRDEIYLSHPWMGQAVTLPLPRSSGQGEFPGWLNEKEDDAFRCDFSAVGFGGVKRVATRLGSFLLLQSEHQPEWDALGRLREWILDSPIQAVYWKRHDRSVQQKGKTALSPQRLWGKEEASGTILESGVRYGIDFTEGYSFGLFLDQRENRRRLLDNQVTAGVSLFPRTLPDRPLVLNSFAYTCGYSVCAALAGAKVVSVDLSRKYLAWGKRNFAANDLNPEEHEFLYGDVFGWVKRFARRNCRFDLIILDPPTFSRSKEWGVFKVERDLEKLMEWVVPLVNPGGWILVSSNAAFWSPGDYMAQLKSAINRGGRRLGRHQYATQPWDFGWVSGETSYLKTCWYEILAR